MSNIAPGDVVVCVDAGPSDIGYAPPELIEGGIYHVYAIGYDGAGELGLFLDEMDSEGYAGGYLAYRFRKVKSAGPAATVSRGEVVPA